MKKIKTLVFGLIIIMLSACSSAPSEDVVKAIAIEAMAPQFYMQDAPREVWILEDWEISNEYQKEIDGENIYLYEFKTNVKVRGWNGGTEILDSIHDYGPMSGILALVKRGSKWYAFQ